MTKTENFEQVEVTSTAQLRDWLSANHEQDASVWLVTYKKHVTAKYVSTGEVLDALLAFGWIDGIRRKLDDDRTMQLIAKRRTQHWTQSYKDRVDRLREAGLMHEAGEQAIERSQQNGMWDFMADVDALICPPDLIAALSPQASAHFDAYPPSYRRNVLRWIKLAKTEPTRAKRIAEVAHSSAQNTRIPQM